MARSKGNIPMNKTLSAFAVAAAMTFGAFGATAADTLDLGHSLAVRPHNPYKSTRVICGLASPSGWTSPPCMT
jgi:hypothetical protein